MINNRNTEKGFTLVEIAVVMVIGGILTSMLYGLVTTTMRSALLRENNTKIEFIQEELNRYLHNFGRFPCPSRINVAVDTANFGVSALTDCSTNTPVFGTWSRNGRAIASTPGPDRIRIGGVPTRTLNLPDEYAYDAYGTRFTYAVTGNMTNSNLYRNDIGAIFVNGSVGNTSVIAPAGSAAYVVVSHGANQSGGYTGLGGTLISACALPIRFAEVENCDNDQMFRASIVPSTNPADYYDDQVVYYVANTRNYEIPNSAVMQFNAPNCPPGWQAYAGVMPVDANHVMCIKI